jgi:hypothetical protein
MSSIGTLTLTGKSGKTYLFNIYILNSTFVKAGGLYLFTKKVDITHHFIYIGRTEDLSSRFTDHHKQECIDGKGATHICIHWLDGKDALINAETDLLAAYNFTCNETLNPGR